MEFRRGRPQDARAHGLGQGCLPNLGRTGKIGYNSGKQTPDQPSAGVGMVGIHDAASIPRSVETA